MLWRCKETVFEVIVPCSATAETRQHRIVDRPVADVVVGEEGEMIAIWVEGRGEVSAAGVCVPRERKYRESYIRERLEVEGIGIEFELRLQHGWRAFVPGGARWG